MLGFAEVDIECGDQGMGKVARCLGAAGAAVLLSQAPATGWADTAPEPKKPDNPMTSSQFQGVSCIVANP
jgi:hypothetical protein